MSVAMPNNVHIACGVPLHSRSAIQPQMKRHQREGTLQCQQLRGRTAVAHLHLWHAKGSVIACDQEVQPSARAEQASAGAACAASAA